MGIKDKLLQENLKQIKKLYEDAIKKDGSKGTESLIRSSGVICLIHEYIKEELIAQGVNPDFIHPPPGCSSPEIKLMGFLKGKNQDIMVIPQSFKEEEINDGVLIGAMDKVGKDVSNKSISINIRSQLSSLGKNFDTLYERTFAEALNLHLRLPELVCGEVYLIPLIAYNPNVMDDHIVQFKEKLPTKYIPAFRELNNRQNIDVDDHKYEKVCLLIVDFRKNQPEIINDVKQIQEAGIINEDIAKKITLNGLTINNFVSDILEIYKKRHGSLDILKNGKKQSRLNF